MEFLYSNILLPGRSYKKVNMAKSAILIGSKSGRETAVLPALTRRQMLLHRSDQRPFSRNDSSSSHSPTTRDRSPQRKYLLNTAHSSRHQINLASKDDLIGSLFHGATIKDNVININITPQLQQQPRKRYIIYDSDDE